jgi:Undecaprenyl-phosphate galactose phosphotransferase WbaP
MSSLSKLLHRTDVNLKAAPCAVHKEFKQGKIHAFQTQLYAFPKARHLLQRYVLMDMLALAIGIFSAWTLAAIINSIFFDRTMITPFSEDGMVHLMEFTLIAAAVLIWFQHTDHYHICMPFWIEVRTIVSTLAFAAIADGFLQFASKSDLSRVWLMSGWIITAVAMIALRNLLRAYLRKKGRFQMRTLLVGTGVTAQHTRVALQSDSCLNYEIAAQIDDLPKAFLQAGKSWGTLCAMHGVEYIIIALDGNELTAAKQPLEQLARESVPFCISPPLCHLPVMGMVPQYFMNHDVMLLAHNDGLGRSFPCLVKRVFDIVVSATALVVLSPLMLILALGIKRDNGPAFYGHTRIGRNKKPFSCLKFRSMVMNGDEILERYLAENPAAHEEWKRSQKLHNDPRITRLGKFLRASSLDELPQLLNVLRGEMSLVGPRPIVTAEVTKYDDDIAHYYRVRPGVTGLWQVSGRSDVSYPRRVHMDSWYVRNWSLWHDIAILCKTFPALLNRSGAY